MYKSPIEIVMEELFQKMDEDFENSVFKAVQKVGINVDKEELLKALIYDRGQYDEGYLECIKSNDLSNTFFQEGRFYPITIPNIGDKNG